MKILIVEDHELLGLSVKRGLEDQGWTVDWARDGEEGLYLIKNSSYDLALIDCMLPKIEGLEVARYVREKKLRMAMIMITARGSLDDKISGLEFTDDYIVKPFEMSELIARVKSVYRRFIGTPTENIQAGPLTINIKEKSAHLQDHILNLTAKEFELLRVLAIRNGEVCTRQELGGLLYEYEEEPTSNSLDVLIARLRKKLAKSSVTITTLRSQGFILRA